MTATVFLDNLKSNLLMIVLFTCFLHLMASVPTSLQVIVIWNLAMKFAGMMGFDVGLDMAQFGDKKAEVGEKMHTPSPSMRPNSYLSASSLPLAPGTWGKNL